MPRAKKAPSVAPTKSSEAPGNPVVSVNPEPGNAGVKTFAPKPTAAKSTNPKSNGDLEAAIRARAYQIYEERGRTDGLAQDDWVRAEREVLAQQTKRSA